MSRTYGDYDTSVNIDRVGLAHYSPEILMDFLQYIKTNSYTTELTTDTPSDHMPSPKNLGN